MGSKQIKLTVSENERQWLEQEAAKHDLSVSAFLHERIFGRDHKTLIGYGELSSVCMNLPTMLLNELKEDADNAGYSLSKYVTILCAQKGRPVIIKVDPVNVMKEMDGFYPAYCSLVELMNATADNGNISEDESLRLIRNISTTWKRIYDLTKNAVDSMQRKLNREIREVKYGNHQNNPDT